MKNVLIIFGIVCLITGCNDSGSSDGGGGSDLFTVPTAAITVDGSAADWSGVPIYITDDFGEATAPDADLMTMYIAKDSTYLYVLIVLSIGNSVNQNLEYHLRYDMANDRSIKVTYSTQWDLTRSFQGSPVATYGVGDIATASERIEYRVPLVDVQTDMENGVEVNGMSTLFAVWELGEIDDYDQAFGQALSFN